MKTSGKTHMFTVADCRVDLEGFHYRNRWEWVAEGVRISKIIMYIKYPVRARRACAAAWAVGEGVQVKLHIV